jgi:hypothetical protein
VAFFISSGLQPKEEWGENFGDRKAEEKAKSGGRRRRGSNVESLES